MRRSSILFIFLVCSFIVYMIPFNALGQNSSNSIALKLGVYEPTGDVEDVGIGSGFSGEVEWTHYFSRNFSIGFGVGYFETDETFDFGAFTEKDEVNAIPLFVNAKGHLPFNVVELYGGAGLGLYFASIDIDLNVGGTPISFSDDDTILGFHVLAGLLFDITQNLFLGIEWKYFATDDFSFNDTLVFDSDLDGYTITGVIGFRF